MKPALLSPISQVHLSVTSSMDLNSSSLSMFQKGPSKNTEIDEKIISSNHESSKEIRSSSKQQAARRRDRGPGGMFTTNEIAASIFLLRCRRMYRQYKYSIEAVQLPYKLLGDCSLVLNIQPGQESDIFYKEGERPIKFLEFDVEVRCHENKLLPITVPLVACLHLYNGDPACPIGDYIEELPPSRKRRRSGEDVEEIDENLVPAKKEPLSYRQNSSLLLEKGKAAVGIKPNALSRSFQGSQFVIVFYIDLFTEPLATFVKPACSRPFTVKSKVPTAFQDSF